MFLGCFQLKILSIWFMESSIRPFFTLFLKNSTIYLMIAKGIKGNNKAGWSDLSLVFNENSCLEMKSTTSLSTSMEKGQRFLESNLLKH